MINYGEEGLRVSISPALSDRMYTLATEYSVPVDLLVNLAVKRLIDDVDLLRNLRTGKIPSG